MGTRTPLPRFRIHQLTAIGSIDNLACAPAVAVVVVVAVEFVAASFSWAPLTLLFSAPSALKVSAVPETQTDAARASAPSVRNIRFDYDGPATPATRIWPSTAAGTYGNIFDGFDVTDSLPIPR